MLEYINNINFEDSMNKDLILNLYKTKSSNIYSVILSKIVSYDKISDFFNIYTDIDFNSISKSINNINKKLSNVIFPNPKFAKDNLEQYINILSTFILTIHYILKLKIIFQRKIEEFQTILIKNMIDNNLGDAYKDKIIEFNSLSSSAFNMTNLNNIRFPHFKGNRPKIYNHFNTNGQRYFDLESPTPKFFDLKKDSKVTFGEKKAIKGKINRQIEEIEEFNNIKPTNKSSCSLISMSSIIFINENQQQKISIKKSVGKNCKNRNSKKRMTVPKKQYKIHQENYEKKKVFSDKTLEKEQYKSFNVFDDNKQKYKAEDEKNIEYNYRKSNIKKEVNTTGNKELFIELLKFANDLYQKKYIDENQKKFLKQLIIMYIQ